MPSEETDATILVVSEETATISVASHGRLYRPLTPAEIREVLSGSRGLEDMGEPVVSHG